VDVCFPAAENREKVAQQMEEFAKNIDVSFYAYNLSLILQNIY
jgi:uncharacterized ferredoxin-like protein